VSFPFSKNHQVEWVLQEALKNANLLSIFILQFSFFNLQSLLQNPFNLMVFVKGKRHGDESIVC